MSGLTSETKPLADGRLLVELRGKLNEMFDGQALLDVIAGQKAVLHMAGVRHISSVGIREFERFLERLGPTTLVEVSSSVASHLVLLPTLSARLQVESVQLPFICNSCGAERVATVPFALGAAVKHAPECTCGRRMMLDGIAEQYLPSAP